ncbi:MAG: CopD family protein, partial [Pseudomonadota bacterium]|nr:CopD family protein [Pseudomonadota bacterium]
FAIIMVPAAWLAYLTGGTMLLAKPELLLERWMIVKLMAVVLMTALHLMMTGWRDDFAADSNRHAHVFYRVINEVPTVLVIVIVIMAIIEPF